MKHSPRHTNKQIAGKSWRGSSDGDSATAQVLQLLDERYFVPVLRAADHTAPAQIGRPCTPDQVGSGPPQQPKTPAPSADSTTGDQAGPPAKSWSQRRLNVAESPFFVQVADAQELHSYHFDKFLENQRLSPSSPVLPNIY